MLIFNHLKNTCTQQPSPTERWTWLRNSCTWCISTALRSSPRGSHHRDAAGTSHMNQRVMFSVWLVAGRQGQQKDGWATESVKVSQSGKSNGYHYFLECFFCSTHQPLMNISHNTGSFTLLNTRYFQFSSTFFAQLTSFCELKSIISTNLTVRSYGTGHLKTISLPYTR